jgi:ABC-type cobalamin/Fe3+-siderophores transport system ATPase subunit
MHKYLISGLRVCSEIILPGAIPEDSQGEHFDVAVRRAEVPVELDNANVRGVTWAIAHDRFLLRVPRLARFLIVAGRDITVELESGTTDHDVAGFVLGSAFGILLHQRHALVLHGAAVARDGRAMVICGESGAGKSTLAAALCNEGYAFIADDICVIGLDSEKRPVVLPDGRQLKLWRASIDHLDLAARRGDAVRNAFEKYYIEPAAIRAAPTPLAAIYELREARPPLKEGIEKAALPDALRMLDRQAYRPALRARMGLKSAQLAQSAALFTHAAAFRLIRPGGFSHLTATTAMLRAHRDVVGG